MNSRTSILSHALTNHSVTDNNHFLRTRIPMSHHTLVEGRADTKHLVPAMKRVLTSSRVTTKGRVHMDSREPTKNRILPVNPLSQLRTLISPSHRPQFLSLAIQLIAIRGFPLSPTLRERSPCRYGAASPMTRPRSPAPMVRHLRSPSPDLHVSIAQPGLFPCLGRGPLSLMYPWMVRAVEVDGIGAGRCSGVGVVKVSERIVGNFGALCHSWLPVS
jgi:hypothetical protein